MCLNARGALAEKHTESAWMIQLRSLQLAAKEAGGSVLHMHAMAPYAMEDPSACTMPLASEARSVAHAWKPSFTSSVCVICCLRVWAPLEVSTPPCAKRATVGLTPLSWPTALAPMAKTKTQIFWLDSLPNPTRRLLRVRSQRRAVLKRLRAETIKRVADQNAGVGGKRGREK